MLDAASAGRYGAAPVVQAVIAALLLIQAGRPGARQVPRAEDVQGVLDVPIANVDYCLQYNPELATATLVANPSLAVEGGANVASGLGGCGMAPIKLAPGCARRWALVPR